MARIEKLYTLSEAADMLGDHVTESSLCTEIKRKNLSYRKVDSKRYVTESDLVAALAAIAVGLLLSP